MGPIRPPSRGGAKYMVSFVDNYTRCAFVYFISSKSQVFDRFKELNALVQTQHGRYIKCLRKANNGEYVSKKFNSFSANAGIIRQTSAPYSRQQNGLSERMNKTLTEMARSMIHYMHVNRCWWAEAITTAVYIVNHIPNTLRPRMSPFKDLHGKRPDLNHLRVFGSRGYVRVDDSKRSKLEPKAHRCIFVGYLVGSKAYRVWDLDEERLVTTRTVELDERPPSPYLNLTDASKPATIINLDVDDKSTSMPAHTPQPFQSDIDMEVDSSGIVEEDVVMDEASQVLTSRAHDLPATPIRGRMDAIVPVNSDDSRSTSIVPRHLYVPAPTQLEVSSQPENRLVFNGGDARFILGMELDHNRDSGIMVLKQQQFIAKLLDRFGQCEANPVRNPLVIGQDLSRSDEHAALDNKSRYRELIGALLYVANANRPDICMYLSMLYQYLEEPRKLHWNEAVRVLRYLKGTATLGITFTRDNESIDTYSDAKWGGDKADMHIDLRAHFVRDYVEKGDIDLPHVPSEDQLADFLTKALPTPRLVHLRASCGISHRTC
ncbi:hypothetical protein PsorP6_012618 [Peronosclerospora sorghi]|uniref:Uncharacterized protein n=1 Tax=Peronosclerospora sorghi TaxID=230839 RepID=A0ACC0WJC4_9STRA|nr:hypothetical protein PsorP6_012618 [Peronosclerospora sorghi]